RLAETGGNAFEEHDIRAGRLEPLGTLDHLRGRVLLPPLHAKAACLVHGLRPKPEVRAYRDVVTCQELDDVSLAAAALELHHLGAAFLHEADRVLERAVLRGITHERKIGDE